MPLLGVLGSDVSVEAPVRGLSVANPCCVQKIGLLLHLCLCLRALHVVEFGRCLCGVGAPVPFVRQLCVSGEVSGHGARRFERRVRRRSPVRCVVEAASVNGEARMSLRVRSRLVAAVVRTKFLSPKKAATTKKAKRYCGRGPQ